MLHMQMEVLKSNLERADSEIVQLDDIVDQVVEVCMCIY